MTTDELNALADIHALAENEKLDKMLAAGRAEGLSDSDLQEVSKILENRGAHLCAIGAYLGERAGFGCGDQGHEKAVKSFNKVMAKCRKVCGYIVTFALKF